MYFFPPALVMDNLFVQDMSMSDVHNQINVIHTGFDVHQHEWLYHLGVSAIYITCSCKHSYVGPLNLYRNCEGSIHFGPWQPDTG